MIFVKIYTLTHLIFAITMWRKYYYYYNTYLQMEEMKYKQMFF